MANHLISNALLRPHGTNNPYNTLLGEPAVCNNPSVSMYNAQGVLEFILIFSSESPILCSFYGHILFFFPSSCLFFLLEADTQISFTFYHSWCFYFPFSLGFPFPFPRNGLLPLVNKCLFHQYAFVSLYCYKMCCDLSILSLLSIDFYNKYLCIYFEK